MLKIQLEDEINNELMPIMSLTNVKNTEITIIKHNNQEYISLTNMLKVKDGDFFISD